MRSDRIRERIGRFAMYGAPAVIIVNMMACGNEDVSGIPSGFIDYYAVEGTVTDATGAPVAGATVEAVEIFSVESPQPEWDDCGEGEGIALAPVNVTAAGTFHFSGGTRISFFCIFAVAEPPEGRSLLPDTATIQDVIFSDFNPPLDTMRLDFVLRAP